MSNPVSVTDLEARFRPLTEPERGVAQALLEDAWAIALTQAPALDGGLVDVSVVRAVISAMVLRVLRNPDGVRTWSVDDYSQTRDASVAGGSLYLSAEELALLSPTGGAGEAFTITPAYAPGYALPWGTYLRDPFWW